MFVSCAGAGAMVAAMSLAARRGSHNLSKIALAGNFAAVIGLPAFSTTSWMPLGIAGMFLVGLGIIAQAVATNMTIQKRVPDDKRGRVLALYTAMFIGGTPLGSLIFGQLGQVIGASQALFAGALLAMIGLVWTAWQIRA
jgi:predicted MFS family arabinose efflux permease